MASIRKRGNSWNAQIRIKGWQQIMEMDWSNAAVTMDCYCPTSHPSLTNFSKNWYLIQNAPRSSNEETPKTTKHSLQR